MLIGMSVRMKSNNRFNLDGLFLAASLVYLLGLFGVGLNVLASYPPPVNRGVMQRRQMERRDR